MTLIVAPDTGAQSLCSVATADAYHADRGNAAWALLTTTAKEQALRRATDYMAIYTAQWKGQRTNLEQPLDWPRWGASVHGYLIDTTTVPLAVANACAALALKASTEELAPDLEGQVISEAVGPISVTYAPGARQSKKFAAVDAMLAPYLGGGSTSARMTRS